MNSRSASNEVNSSIRARVKGEPLRFGRWPLGVNPEMDNHAARLGLSHWSCVSTKSNNWWIRADGEQFEAFLTGSWGGYPEELEAFDLRRPMEDRQLISSLLVVATKEEAGAVSAKD